MPGYGQYGQPVPPSQPWQPTAGQEPTVPWGPPSQGLPGGMPPNMPLAAPPAPKKSRRGLWITLGVIAAVLVLLGGGGVYGASLYFAPAVTVGQFCGFLETQNYSSAYNLLSSGLRAQASSAQFSQVSATLDTVEGKVTKCGSATSGSPYNYSFGSNTATVEGMVTRSTAGNLQGAIHLKNENGWKVDSIDTSLLGVNLAALETAGAFCTAMQSQDYATAYGLLGSSAQALVTQAQFNGQAQLHDQIDGTVSSCGLVGLGQGNSDTSATLVAQITRSKLGQKQGGVALDIEGGTWKIAMIDPALQGTDLGPLLVGERFCTDLQNGSYADAYGLLSTNGKGGLTEAQFAAILKPPSPYKWGACTPDLSTYTVSGTSASYTAAFELVNPSTGAATPAVNFKLAFVQDNGTWLLDILTQG
jgi:hypothetical protein